MTLFLISAVVAILLSWAFIGRSRRLAIPASFSAGIPALLVFRYFQDTWDWLGAPGIEIYDPTFVALGFACAVLPFVATIALLLAKEYGPNRVAGDN